MMHPSLLDNAARQRAMFAAVFAHFGPIDFDVYVHAARYRGNYIAALRAHVVVMRLTKDFLSLFNVATNAQDLVLAVQGEHIRLQRRDEAQTIIEALPLALNRLKYIGRRNSHGIEHMAVGEGKLGRLLLIGMKFVPSARARSQEDEAWVTTAYSLRASELRRLLRKQQLRPLL